MRLEEWGFVTPIPWHSMVEAHPGEYLLCKECWHQWTVDGACWIDHCPNCENSTYGLFKERVVNTYKVFKNNSRAATARMIREGSLRKEPCSVCGAEGTVAHHDNYLKPFDVRWMCVLCHVRYHKQLLKQRNTTSSTPLSIPDASKAAPPVVARDPQGSPARAFSQVRSTSVEVLRP